jgi:hypothetical protein
MFAERPWFKAAMTAVWIASLASLYYSLSGKLQFVAGCGARLDHSQAIAAQIAQSEAEVTESEARLDAAEAQLDKARR